MERNEANKEISKNKALSTHVLKVKDIGRARGFNMRHNFQITKVIPFFFLCIITYISQMYELNV